MFKMEFVMHNITPTLANLEYKINFYIDYA